MDYLRQMKTPIIAVSLVALLFLGITYGFVYLPKLLTKRLNIKIRNATLYIEVADTPTKREQGLMYLRELASDHGMLFIFPKEDIYTFWMKNTLILLDMLWISDAKKVVYIQRNAQPCNTFKPLEDTCPTYYPASPAAYVLEVNGGWVDKFGVEVGDVVSF